MAGIPTDCAPGSDPGKLPGSPPPCCAPCSRPRICGTVTGSLHSPDRSVSGRCSVCRSLATWGLASKYVFSATSDWGAALLLGDRRQRLVGLRMRVQVGTRRVGHRPDGLGDRLAAHGSGAAVADGIDDSAGMAGRRSWRRLRRRPRTRRTGCDGQSHLSGSSTVNSLRFADIWCLANGCDRRQMGTDAVAAKMT